MREIRIIDALDSEFCNTHVGFRKGKSTAEALFCAKRLTDVVKQGYGNLFLVFLDWEKAFHKIDREKYFNRSSGSTSLMKSWTPLTHSTECHYSRAPIFSDIRINSMISGIGKYSKV